MASGDPLIEGKAGSGAALTNLNGSSLGLGSAATRNAEDTLTNGSNLPDGAAIKAYGDANWGGGSGGSPYSYTLGASTTLAQAVTAANSTGGKIFVPRGTWTTTGVTITKKGVVIVGEGKTSKIVNTSGSNDTITIYGTESCGIKDVSFSGTTGTGNAHIYLNNTSLTVIRDVYIQDGYYSVAVNEGDDNVFSNVVSQAVPPYNIQAGFYVTGSPSFYLNNSSTISNGTSSYHTYGMEIHGSDGIKVDCSYFGDSNLCDIYIVSASGDQVTNLAFNNCYFDGANFSLSTHSNVSIANSAGYLAGIKFVGCDFHGGNYPYNVGRGLRVLGSSTTLANMIVDSCLFYRHDYQGIYIEGGQQISLVGNHVVEASTYSSNTYAGIDIAGGRAYTITGNTSGLGLTSTSSAVQKYGLWIHSGIYYYIVDGNDFIGNATSSMRIDPTATAYNVVGNNAQDN